MQDFGLGFVNEMASGVKSDISHDTKAKVSLEKSLPASASSSKAPEDDPYGVYSLQHV